MVQTDWDTQDPSSVTLTLPQTLTREIPVYLSLLALAMFLHDQDPTVPLNPGNRFSPPLTPGSSRPRT